MFRSLFIYLSKAGWARSLVTRWSLGWKLASRFIAGETLGDAMETIKELNRRGINATLDHLGEHTKSADLAVKATQDILMALEAIEESNARANVSIKLTQIGLIVDPQLCLQNLEKILQYAAKKRNFIRVDMEDSAVTQKTLDFLYQMRNDGYSNVGAVIQSYLYRSEDDTRQLAGKGVPVRLCKGAYKEPPEVAFQNKKDVDENLDNLTEILIDGAIENGAPQLSEDGKVPPMPSIGSHDDIRIDFAKRYARKKGLHQSAIEFQMLNGIRRDLQENLAKEGYPVRVYVPYGTEWYPYMMRRLAERPANIWFFISNYFKR